MLLRPIEFCFHDGGAIGRWQEYTIVAEVAPLRKRTYKAGAHPHNLHPETHIPISHTSSPDYKTMSGPADGKYYIQLASSDRQPRIGVDYVEGLPVVPRVITDGRNNVVSPLVFVQCQLRSNTRSSLVFLSLYDGMMR